MPAFLRGISLATAIALFLGGPAAAGASPGANGAIERPAPDHMRPVEKPAPLRPDHDLAAALNAIIAAQMAEQQQAQPGNAHKLPRPRPDREYLVEIARSRG